MFYSCQPCKTILIDLWFVTMGNPLLCICRSFLLMPPFAKNITQYIIYWITYHPVCPWYCPLHQPSLLFSNIKILVPFVSDSSSGCCAWQLYLTTAVPSASVGSTLRAPGESGPPPRTGELFEGSVFEPEPFFTFFLIL